MGWDNLCTSYWELICRLIWKTGSFFTKFFFNTVRLCECKNAKLFFCGFSAILIPLFISYWLAVLSILAAEVCLFIVGSVALGVIFMLLGIWPALIITLGATVISIVRVPCSMYYHGLITYRTVIIRRSLKLAGFLLLPVLVLSPIFTLMVSLVTSIPICAAVSFCGYPLEPWVQISFVLGEFWARTDLQEVARNYGHPSGIPAGWDGNVYGLPLDPIIILICILLFLYGVVPVTIGLFSMLAFKAIPIFLHVLIVFWEKYSLGESLQVYKEEVKRYSEIRFCEEYGRILKVYSKILMCFHPRKLVKLVSEYCTDCSPLKLIPDDLGTAVVCLWFPILLSAIMWLIGLCLVVTIPPLSCLLGFALWLATWSLVLGCPPIIYLLGWFYYVLALPTMYVVLWIVVVFAPWICLALGMVSGPLLAFKVPFTVLSSSLLYRMDLCSSIKVGLQVPLHILKFVDNFTATHSLGKIRIWHTEEGTPVMEDHASIRIDYWDLFCVRCIKDADDALVRKWLSREDLAAASSNATIAVPGLAILGILVESIKTDPKNKTLIYWNESNQCTEMRRDWTDNIANHFWPLIMKVKRHLECFHFDDNSCWQKNDLDAVYLYIAAKLCDGEDDKSKELQHAIDKHDFNANVVKKLHGIRAEIEDIVHSLLRVSEMQQRLKTVLGHYSSNP